MCYLAKGEFKLPEFGEKKTNIKQRPQSKENNRILKNAGKNILDLQPVKDDSSCRKIQKQFETDLLPPISAKSQKKIPGKQNGKVKVQDSIDQNLISSMEQRIKKVQITCNNQRQEIKLQNITIEKLKGENTFLKGLRHDSGEALAQMNKLKEQNATLLKKVFQMENYLKEYGLKWIGNKIEGKLDQKKIKKDIKKPKFDYKLPSQIDINTVKRRIDELNMGLQSQGYGNQIYVDHGIHKFRKAEPLVIQFYKEGIQIKGYQFFNYKSENSLKILSDILDGYFPYVLKAKYPNGVFLKVVDKIQQKHQKTNLSEQPLKENQNPNSRIGSVRKPIKKVMSEKILPSIKQQHQNQDYEEIQGNLVLKTPEHQKLLQNLISEESICSLKIRTNEGRTCIIQISKNKSIKTVYMWMSRIVKKKFNLMSNYPLTTYEQNSTQTLEDLGLFPNALLHIHLIPQDLQ